MPPRMLALLSVATTLLLGVSHAESFAKVAPRADEPSILHPIHLRDYESAMGLHRRGEVAVTDLDPSTKAHMFYGTPGGMSKSCHWEVCPC